MALSEEQGRAVLALADVAWAYGEAAAEGDTARASQLLATFQSLYSSYASNVRAFFTGAALDAVPESLVPSGSYDSKTYSALMATWMAYFGAPTVGDALRVMPSTAAKFGEWFTNVFKPAAVDSAAAIGKSWELARTTAPIDIPEKVGGEAEALILGLEAESPEAPREPSPTLRVNLPTSFFETQRTYQRGLNVPVEQTQPQAPSTTSAAGKGFPTWGYVVLGLAGVTVLGVIAVGVSR